MSTKTTKPFRVAINLSKIALASLVSLFISLPALCQRDYDPNLSHFYMGRQQITIEDNSPVIINRTGSAPGGMQQNGALLNRPVPLPKAGWQGYAPVETPGISPNLPKAPGSSPRAKASHTAANKARAGNLSAGKQAKTSTPNGVRSYSPYATYPAPANANTAADLNRSTRVKGSLLHWARRVHKEE